MRYRDTCVHEERAKDRSPVKCQKNIFAVFMYNVWHKRTYNIYLDNVYIC